MHNLATTGAAKRRREQLWRAFHRRRDEQTKGALGLGPACEAGDVVAEGRNQLQGLLSVTQALTELVTVLCQREQREHERAMQANNAFHNNVANQCGTAGPVDAACGGDVSRRSSCERPEHPPGLFWPQDEGTGSCAMSWRSPAACRDAATQAGGPGLLCAEGPCAEGRALHDMQAVSPVSYEVAVQTDDRFDNQPPGDALLLEANSHGEVAGSSCRQRVAILTVLGMPDEQVFAHAQATGDGTMILEKGYDRMRQEICSLAAKKQGFQLLEWSLRRLKTSVGASCFLAWRLLTEGTKTLRQRSAPEEVRVRERRTRALGVSCVHGWRLLAEGAKTQRQQSTSEETSVSKLLTRTWAVKWFHEWRLHAEGARTSKAESKDAAPGETLMVKNPPSNTTDETAQVDIAVEHGRDSRWSDDAAGNGRGRPPCEVPVVLPDDQGRESRRHDVPAGHGRDIRRFFRHAEHCRDSRTDAKGGEGGGRGRCGGGETAHLTHAGSNWVGGGASASKLAWRPKLHASAE